MPARNHRTNAGGSLWQEDKRPPLSSGRRNRSGWRNRLQSVPHSRRGGTKSRRAQRLQILSKKRSLRRTSSPKLRSTASPRRKKLDHRLRGTAFLTLRSQVQLLPQLPNLASNDDDGRLSRAARLSFNSIAHPIAATPFRKTARLSANHRVSSSAMKSLFLTGPPRPTTSGEQAD